MATQSPSRPADGEPLSVAIVRTIAARDGVDPTDLPPLYHTLDGAALDDLFEPTGSGGPRTGSVSFTYAGKRITVDSDGEITIDGNAPADLQETR